MPGRRVPEFLAVGRIVADKAATGLQIGGAAAYAALTAAKLGLRAAVVTNPHSAFDLRAALPGIVLSFTRASASTTFTNISAPTGRLQLWEGRGGAITPKDIPAGWRKVPIVLLVPVAQDLAPAVAGLFPGSLMGVLPQGWLRRLDPSGRVYAGPWRGAKQVLAFADVVVASLEDLGPRRIGVQRYLARAPVLVLTQGASGARLRYARQWRHVPAFPVREVDATGAGDVFAAAFMCAYAEGKDPWKAACFASCAASFAVEGQGFSALPTREQVLARLQTYHQLYPHLEK